MADNSATIAKLRSELETALKSVRHHPSQPYFKSLCKKMAALCMVDDADIHGLFHLTESHGVDLRHRATYRYHQSKMCGQPRETYLDPCYLRFNGSYDEPQGMMKRLKDLPKEWTIVQLTCGGEERPTPHSPVVTPPVWISCLPSGDEAGVVPPLVWRVEHDVRRDKSMPSLLEAVHAIILDNKNKPKQHYNNVALYWRTRQAIADRMEGLLAEVQKCLLKQWCILLLGRLLNSDLELSIRRHVDSVLSAKQLTKLPDRSRHLLYRVAEAKEEMTEDDFESLVATILLPTNADWEEVSTAIREGQFPDLRGASRQPVVLIVDEKLDAIPWESLAILSSHPVSRIESLHMLHALYKAHEHSIVDGHFIVKVPDNGRYMVNAENNLQDMEERMRQFLTKRLPQWTGTFGTVPQDSFKPALTQHDIFLWCGHGNGKQIFSPDSVETLDIKAVSLLMGCSSNNMKNEGGRTPHRGMGQSYHIGNCPCVVGNLWEVSDFDTDRITASLLHFWLPLESSMDTNIATYIDEKLVKKNPWRYEPQKELLRALVLARRRAANLMTQYSIIARGLPVKIVT